MAAASAIPAVPLMSGRAFTKTAPDFAAPAGNNDNDFFRKPEGNVDFGEREYFSVVLEFRQNADKLKIKKEVSNMKQKLRALIALAMTLLMIVSALPMQAALAATYTDIVSHLQNAELRSENVSPAFKGEQNDKGTTDPPEVSDIEFQAFIGDSENPFDCYIGSFTAGAPSEISALSDVMLDAFAAERVGNTIYGFLRNGNCNFFTVDCETMEMTVHGNLTDSLNVVSMSYDYETQTMYAVGVNLHGSGTRSLYVVDLVRGRLFEVGELKTGTGEQLFGFTVGADSVGYGVTWTGNNVGDGSKLCSVNLSTAEVTIIGSTGVGCNGINPMEYDYNTGLMFWAQNDGINAPVLYSVDTETAELIPYGGIGTGTERIHAMYIVNDLPTVDPEIPTFDVTFIDGLDNSVIDTITVQGGTVLSQEDFPAVPAHEGYEFAGWNYENDAICRDTVIIARYIDPNAHTATIILEVGDVWGDGSGYQMLLDATATAYGTMIPEFGPLAIPGQDVPLDLYESFATYTIPEDAVAEFETTTVIFNGCGTIEIPAGVYDWCLVNPNPLDGLWIPGDRGNVGGRQDDYEFLPGYTYRFTPYFDGIDDAVDVEITLNENRVLWDFETREDFEAWTVVDSDGDGYNWYQIDSTYLSCYNGDGAVSSKSYDDAVGALTPDNWLISPEFVAGGKVSFYMMAWDMGYNDENIGIYVISDGVVSEELEYITTSYEYIGYEIDLSAYYGETIRLAFRHYNSTDMSAVVLDYIMAEIGPSTGGGDPVPGDIDGDGIVTTADALLVLRHVLGLQSLDEDKLAVADLDGSGDINIIDVLLILRRSMGVDE